MTTKQQLGSLLWIVLVIAGISSPLWLKTWSFLSGIFISATIYEIQRQANLPGSRAAAIKDIANLLPIVGLMLTVTSPFWLDWYFFIGGVGMAASSELRKEPPVKARQLHLGGPKVVAKRRSFRDEPLDSEVEPAT